MSIPQPIQELLDTSGNSFHARVAQWFAADGWQLQVSPYYLDQVQQKAREVDLLAEKPWPYRDMFGRPEGHVIVQLFIECKYVPGHAVFWFAERNTCTAKLKLAANGQFPLNNSYSDRHHYLSGSSQVAKVFTSSQTKTQEGDLFYKALNQVLSAYTAFRDIPVEPRSLRGSLPGKQIVLQFPLIVCSSFKNVYSADFLGNAPTCPLLRNFQLEVQYAYIDAARAQKNEYFLIDIASLDSLSYFAAAIEVDVEAAIALHASS